MTLDKSRKKGLDYTGVCVVFWCHDGQGKYVFAKRSQNSRDERGCWDCGGGALEFNQTVEDALRTEILGEYCTTIRHIEFLGYRDVHREPEPGIKTHWIALDFKVEIDPLLVAIGEPHKLDEIGWFTIDNLPTPLHSTIQEHLRLYRGRL